MTMQLYVPQDTTACALGADQVAAQLAAEIESRRLDARVVRNGSRGLFWLEPLLEVQMDSGRLAFGSVNAEDMPGVLDALDADPAGHPLCLGRVEEIPYLQRQHRMTFARAGVGDPLCLDNYRALGGFNGLKKALAMAPQE